MYASVLYELREADFYEICRMEEMESPMPSEERVYDRKRQGDSDPDSIDVTKGNPKVDERNDRGDSDPDRVGLTGGGPKVDDRKDKVDSDPGRVGDTGAIQRFPVLEGVI